MVDHLTAQPPDTWLIHCDGSAVPNPGAMGLGAVLLAPDGVRREVSQAAPGRGCNNEAELRALIAALQVVQAHGGRRVCAHSDNRVLVDHLAGTPGGPFSRLAALFDEARRLLATFDEASLRWIPAHRNGEADALARRALGLPPRPAPTRAPRRRSTARPSPAGD